MHSYTKGSGNLSAEYIYGIDGMVTKVDPVAGNLWFVKDHLGSTRRLDSSSMLRDYYPFGEDYTSAGSETDYTFTGKEKDASELYYFGARYYDARIGRWLSVDPLAGKYPGLSPYNYVADNPLKFIDPNGKEIKNPKKYVLGNPNVEKALKALDAKIAEMKNLKSEDFVIVISGGDRYKKDGKIYSSSDNKEIEGSHKKSAHLISSGARGIDFKMLDSKSKISKEDIEKAWKKLGYSQYEDDHKKDPHIHVGLPYNKRATKETYKKGHIPFKESDNKNDQDTTNQKNSTEKDEKEEKNE